MNRSYVAMGLLAAGVCMALTACDTAPESDSRREALTAESHGTVDAFLATDSSLNELMAKSVGYAAFPEVGKAGFIAGGAFGRGEVFERGRMIGYASITQGTLGLQVGAQSYDELIVFLNDDQLNRFKDNQFAFSANASAIAIKSGAGAAADHSKGVIVFVKPRGGLMAEASIGGQQFNFEPLGGRTTTTTTHTKTETEYRKDQPRYEEKQEYRSEWRREEER